MSKWTRFMDMHSGGGCKEPQQYIYIEAPEEEAKVIFFNKFGHSPDRVSCTCCGSDYSVSDGESLEELTAYDRGCDYAYFDKDGAEVPESTAWVRGKGLVDGCVGRYVERPSKKMFSFQKFRTLDSYLALPDVLVVRERDIEPQWRFGEVPEQGYVWR